MTVILQGIVGSTAYGLARPGSDVDRLGVFVAPSEEFFGLNPPVGKAATKVQHEPSDLTLHEIGKFCALALQCNPTILELLWLPHELHEILVQPAGGDLLLLRGAFLSRQRVRDAYYGYAVSQFERLKNRQRFPDVPVNRIEKHARHLRRLLQQGLELYQTGTMSVKVDKPESYFEFGERVGAGDTALAEDMMALYKNSFDNSTSPLLDTPDRDQVESWLRVMRRHFLV